MPKYQIPTLDFEAVAAMDDDARTAALDAYRAEVAALGDALAADEQSDADRQSALAAARYDAAKYKLASDKSCAGFADAMDEIETVLAETPALAAMPDEERLRTAYYIVRGKMGIGAQGIDLGAREHTVNWRGVGTLVAVSAVASVLYATNILQIPFLLVAPASMVIYILVSWLLRDKVRSGKVA